MGHTMKEITLKMIVNAGAIEWQIATFKKLFGMKAKVNLDNLLKAERAGLNVHCLNCLSRLLSTTAYAEYDKAEDAAWDEYQIAFYALRVEGKKVPMATRREYEEVRDAALITAFLKS